MYIAFTTSSSCSLFCPLSCRGVDCDLLTLLISYHYRLPLCRSYTFKGASFTVLSLPVSHASRDCCAIFREEKLPRDESVVALVQAAHFCRLDSENEFEGKERKGDEKEIDVFMIVVAVSRCTAPVRRKICFP